MNYFGVGCESWGVGITALETRSKVELQATQGLGFRVLGFWGLGSGLRASIAVAVSLCHLPRLSLLHLCTPGSLTASARCGQGWRKQPRLET